jgi:Fic family protein
MDYADTPRQGDLDGRGNLSLKALNEFVGWFLKVCIDQVAFMEGLFALDSLASRLKTYTEQRRFRGEAFSLLEAVLRYGELARGEIDRITGLRARTARTLLATLIQDGVLGSETPKGPVALRFPLHAAEILFPRLFPES